ncbi:hypothetical protein V12B01_12945 [Vibrio splendidus 12B01]|nr:hypothetical protein V12B01_12945 [Vibrio splendidus 12B01]
MLELLLKPFSSHRVTKEQCL